MKKNLIRNIIKSALFVLFTVLTVYFFTYYSVLRPAAYGALYKEYISASLVIIICFLNYFVLFPYLYRKRKFHLYAVLSVSSALLAAFAEEMLIFPQVSEIIHQINDMTTKEYSIILAISLFTRNLCFVGFFFLIRLLEDVAQENMEINDSLKRINNLVIAKTDNSKNKNEIITIPLNNIVYCQQEENYTYLFTTDGSKYNRNCSLSNFANQLGDQLVVRISRSVIVFYKHVYSYDNNDVYVEISNQEDVIGFKITDAYRGNAMKLLRKHTKPKQNSKSTGEESNETPYLKESVEITNENGTFFTKNEKNTQFLLEYINLHPECKGSDIANHIQVSLSTVNRILAQLKADGLIEYVGSKKTGGYRVIPPQGPETPQTPPPPRNE